MATTFYNAKSQLDLTADKILTADRRLVNAETQLSLAIQDMTDLQTDAQPLIADIDAAAAANPTDDAWQTAKAEKDLLVVEFQALKVEAEAKLAALQGV